MMKPRRRKGKGMSKWAEVRGSRLFAQMEGARRPEGTSLKHLVFGEETPAERGQSLVRPWVDMGPFNPAV